MIIAEIVRRGHYVSAFDENALPSLDTLLNCDVFIDMSTITKKAFYLSLEKGIERRKGAGLKTPLMIDPPKAILDSFEKARTHELFPDFVPESYNLTGKDNAKLINKFSNDEFLIVKPSAGWWGEGVEKLTPKEALEKHARSKGLIVQKYIPVTTGVGRIITLNYNDDFQIICNYDRVTKSWRTGTDVTYKCVQKPVDKKLRDFARAVSTRCGLYLNGIDYLYHDGKYVLLEVNAVPAIKEPSDEFKINVPKVIIDHIERNAPDGATAA